MLDLLKRPDEVHEEFELPVKFVSGPRAPRVFRITLTEPNVAAGLSMYGSPGEIPIFLFVTDDTQTARYTGFATDNPKVLHIIRSSLTPAIPRVIGRLAAEVDKLVFEYFPQSTDWVEIKPTRPITDVVSIAAGNVLVGQELCRRDEWINGARRYVGAAITAAWTLRQWPWFLRPLVYLRMPEMQGLKATTQAMADVLQPVVEERQRKAKEPGWEQNKPDDFLQWYMDSPMEWDLPLADVMLGVGLVALNSSGAATINAYVRKTLHSPYEPNKFLSESTTWPPDPSTRSLSVQRSRPLSQRTTGS